jgi:hypothetical protein
MPRASLTVSSEPDLKIDLLQIWVHGLEFPDATDAWDSNWLRVTASCSVNGSSVRLHGSELDTVSFATFLDQVQAMADTLKGEARLESLEPNLRVELHFVGSLGQIEGRAEITPDHLNQGHWFALRNLDQSYLPGIIQQVQNIFTKFPVRNPKARGL